jgi:hypothetical protein
MYNKKNNEQKEIQMGVNFEQKKLLELVTNVSVSGLIDSCVVRVTKRGVGIVDAVDMSNSLFVHCEEQVLEKGEEETYYGFPDLSLIRNYLGHVEEVKFSIQGDDGAERHFVMSSRKSGRMRLRLLEVDGVPTAVKDEKAVFKLLDGYKDVEGYKITEEDRTRCSYYLSAVSAVGSITLEAKKTSIRISNEEDSSQHFEFQFGKNVGGVEDASVTVYGDHFLSVLKNMDLADGELTIFVKSEMPVVFKKGKNIWALNPLV